MTCLASPYSPFLFNPSYSTAHSTSRQIRSTHSQRRPWWSSISISVGVGQDCTVQYRQCQCHQRFRRPALNQSSPRSTAPSSSNPPPSFSLSLSPSSLFPPSAHPHHPAPDSAGLRSSACRNHRPSTIDHRPSTIEPSTTVTNKSSGRAAHCVPGADCDPSQGSRSDCLRLTCIPSHPSHPSHLTFPFPSSPSFFLHPLSHTPLMSSLSPCSSHAHTTPHTLHFTPTSSTHTVHTVGQLGIGPTAVLLQTAALAPSTGCTPPFALPSRPVVRHRASSRPFSTRLLPFHPATPVGSVAI